MKRRLVILKWFFISRQIEIIECFNSSILIILHSFFASFSSLFDLNDNIFLIYKINIWKKIKKNERTFRISFKRVLIENEIIRLHEDEIKKIENVMLKKMTAKTKNLSLQKKSEFMRKKTTIRKRKRKENKIIKKLKKNSKSKRFYRRRLQNSSISVFSTSQMRKTTSEIEKLILQIEKNKVDNSASSIKDYVYQ